jgi:uncharacterized protein (DUF1697 family)
MKQQYIALLRGINVGGNRKIKMADLKKILIEIGLEQVQTYIQSGNVVFFYKKEKTELLSEMIKKAVKEAYGFDIETITFEVADFRAIVENMPFEVNETNIKTFHIMMLKTAVEEDGIVEKLDKYITTGEIIQPTKKVLYLQYPNGFGRSKLTNNVVEKTLKISSTTRNWRTMNKILGLCD